MRRLLLPLLFIPAALAACGDADGGRPAAADAPVVAVTTDILGDVVSEIVGDLAEVEVVMPAGVDPHAFQPSPRQAELLTSADAVVANGGGFEEAMLPLLEAAEAEGVPVFEALGAVQPLDGQHADEETGHADEEAGHPQEGHGDEAPAHEEHDHGGGDPHFFTDPLRMARAVEGIAAFLAAELPGVDAAALERQADTYAAELRDLHAQVERTLAAVPEERRRLVTNHEVFAYFADRYGFEIVGAVVPGGGTTAEASAGDLAELAATIRDTGVPAIFVETSAPTRLAEALAAEAGDVAVVELFTESLGGEGSEAETYVEMVRTNARRIAGALAP